MNDLKQFFANMQGLEWVNWYILKPIALILTVIAFIVLQGDPMNIWNENYIVKIPIKIDDCSSIDEVIEKLENKLDKNEINLNKMEFYIEEIKDEY